MVLLATPVILAFDGDPYYPSLGLVGTGKYNGDQTFYISSVQNDGLTWEKQKTINIGLSARLFDRLDIDLAYYDKKTTDMLMTIPYSYTTGHSSGWGNKHRNGCHFPYRTNLKQT